MNKLDIHIKNGKKYNLYQWKTVKIIIIILLFIYLSILFYVTLFAWNHGSSYGPLGPGGRNYNLVPFRSIYRIAFYSPDIVDPLIILGGNVVMFLPFGILSAAGLEGHKKTLWLISLLSVVLSVFIEVNQYIFTHRVANVDDVMLNTAGGILGTLFVVLLRSIIVKFPVKERQKTDHV